MVQDEGNKETLDIVKNTTKFLYQKIKAILKSIRSAAWNAIKPRQLGNTRKLLRKNPNQGVYRKENLEKDEAKAIAKELKKHRQEFTFEQNKETGKIDIVVTAGNKSLVEDIGNKFNKKTEEEKDPADKQIADANEKAKEINAKNEHQRVSQLKHKEIDAR